MALLGRDSRRMAAVYGPAGRAACLGYVEVHRMGPTPRSARVAMA
ncbi:MULTISPECIES: hypothetical protein [unclassified Streptomyces]